MDPQISAGWFGDSIQPPDPSHSAGGATELWEEIDMLGCCCYRDPAHQPPSCVCSCCPQYCQQCTCCPIWFPQSLQAACLTFGQIVSLRRDETPVCGGRICGMGKQGLAACAFLCPCVCFSQLPLFSVCAALATLRQHQIMVQSYGLNDTDGRCKVFCCYSCALWKHYIFLSKLHRPYTYSPKSSMKSSPKSKGLRVRFSEEPPTAYPPTMGDVGENVDDEQELCTYEHSLGVGVRPVYEHTTDIELADKRSSYS